MANGWRRTSGPLATKVTSPLSPGHSPPGPWYEPEENSAWPAMAPPGLGLAWSCRPPSVSAGPPTRSIVPCPSWIWIEDPGGTAARTGAPGEAWSEPKDTLRPSARRSVRCGRFNLTESGPRRAPSSVKGEACTDTSSASAIACEPRFPSRSPWTPSSSRPGGTNSSRTAPMRTGPPNVAVARDSRERRSRSSPHRLARGRPKTARATRTMTVRENAVNRPRVTGLSIAGGLSVRRRDAPGPHGVRAPDVHEGAEGGQPAADDEGHEHLVGDPCEIDDRDFGVQVWPHELQAPQEKDPPGLDDVERHVGQKQHPEHRLRDRQQDLRTLEAVERDVRRRPDAETIDDRNHRGEHRPLVDVGRHHVHQGHRRFFRPPRPVHRAELLGKLRQKWRHPLDEQVLRHAEVHGKSQHAVQKRLGREVQEQPAAGEQKGDGQDLPAPGQTHDPSRDRLEVLH